MAANPNAPHEYDMSQANEMWKSFGRIARWVVGISIVTLALMAMFLV